MHVINPVLSKQSNGPSWIIVIILLFSAIYNTQFSEVRIAIIILLTVLPVFVFLSDRSKNNISELFHPMLASTAWVFYFILWGILNFGEIELELSGPKVEMLTPALYLTAIFTLPVIANLDPRRLRLTVNYFLWFYTLFLLTEAAWRYFEEPYCFLNYGCRFEAKTVGYFSTTNALATSLTAILASIVYYRPFQKMKFGTLAGVLVTSMARAAIISTTTVFIIYIFNKMNVFGRIIVAAISFFAIYYVFENDPFNILQDGSGISKIQFFTEAYYIIYNADLFQLFFGFGSNFDYITALLGVNDWSPHSPILKALLYFGFIGVVLHLYSLFSFYKLNRNLFLPIMSFFILGFAGAPLYFPTFIVCFAIVRSGIVYDVPR